MQFPLFHYFSRKNFPSTAPRILHNINVIFSYIHADRVTLSFIIQYLCSPVSSMLMFDIWYKSNYVSWSLEYNGTTLCYEQIRTLDIIKADILINDISRNLLHIGVYCVHSIVRDSTKKTWQNTGRPRWPANLYCYRYVCVSVSGFMYKPWSVLGRVAWYAVYICGNFWVTQYKTSIWMEIN